MYQRNNPFRTGKVTRQLFTAAMALICGVGLTVGVTSAQSFSGLGFLADGTESYARAASSDGSTIVGFGFIPPDPGDLTGFRAFRWTSGGMENMLHLPGGQYSNGRGISDNGAVVVGWSGTATTTHAYRWTNPVDGMVDLGTLPSHTWSEANDASANGSVVVGRSGTNSYYFRAFRWTNAGMQDLGALSGYVSSEAYGVSGDGATVVGYCRKSADDTKIAARWKSGTWTNLGKLKGGANSEAWATSDNGSVIVGISDSSTGPRAFRWTGNKMANLGTISGQPYSYAMSVCGDGSAVVGYADDGTTETLPGSGSIKTATGRAFLWTSSLGMVDLNDYLDSTLGLDLTGWTLREARGISADGKAIVGWGWHDDGVNGPRPEAWVAHLP